MIEEETNPLWMPKGSLRALRMLFLTGILGFMVLNGDSVPGWFQLIAVGDLASYSLTRTLAPRSIQVKQPVDLEAEDLLQKVRKP